MAMFENIIKGKKGVTLIELLIAISLLLVVSIGTIPLFLSVIKFVDFPMKLSKVNSDSIVISRLIYDSAIGFESYTDYQSVKIPYENNYYKIETAGGGTPYSLISTSSGGLNPEPPYEPIPWNNKFGYVINIKKNDLNGDGVFDSALYNIKIKENSETSDFSKSYSGSLVF